MNFFDELANFDSEVSAACGRELLKRQEEFYRNRQKTMETLQVLGAQALSEEIGSSVMMPKNSRGL